MNSDTIKACVAGYWRYKKQFMVVALEANSGVAFWSYGGVADVIAVDGRRRIIETEVKISIADMKVDLAKAKHNVLRSSYLETHPGDEPLLHSYEWGKWTTKYSGHEFYFALPEELIDEAEHIRHTYYPYAGLISVNIQPFYGSLSMFGIRIFKSAYHFDKPKANISILTGLVKDQSATLTRLAVENCRLKKIEDLRGEYER